MSAIPRPARDAVPGELVNYYESGDPSEKPVVLTVESVYGGQITGTYQKVGHPTVVTVYSVKHIHSPYWDNLPINAKQAAGAFDFHPVYKGLFDKWLSMEHARKARMEKLEQDKADMTDDEFNAISALERHGDNIGKISDETGVSRERLKKLPRFMEELKAVKQRNWEEKNATPEVAQETAAQAE